LAVLPHLQFLPPPTCHSRLRTSTLPTSRDTTGTSGGCQRGGPFLPRCRERERAPVPRLDPGVSEGAGSGYPTIWHSRASGGGRASHGLTSSRLAYGADGSSMRPSPNGLSTWRGATADVIPVFV